MSRKRLSWPRIVEQARVVVAGYDGVVTVRQVFYVLAAAGEIPLTQSAYKHLSEHLAAARRRGEFPPGRIIDGGRRVHQRPWYDTPGELLDIVPALYRVDRTAGQRVALYVGVEKATLEVQVTGWLDRYGVPVLVVRGYGSQTYVDEVAARVADDPRPAVLLYVGDLDASGEDIERDWVARTGCWAEVRRLAVTVDQVLDAAGGLQPAPGKTTDPRWPAFAERHGLNPAEPVQYEVEAMPPAELHALVLTAVDQLVNADLLDQAIEREADERHHLRAFLDDWTDPQT